MRIFSLFVLLFLAGTANAQPKWWLAGGASVENPSFRWAEYDNEILLHPFVETGMLLEFRNSESVVYWHWSYQRADIGPGPMTYTLASGIEQHLLIGNLRMGPGIRCIPWKKRALRPVLGIEFLAGVPLTFEYEFINTHNDSNYPWRGKIRDGAGIGAGVCLQLGGLYRLNEHLRISLLAGYTDFKQYFGEPDQRPHQWDIGSVFQQAFMVGRLSVVYLP